VREAQCLALGPLVDGDVCEASVTDALAAGVGADKPLLFGTCAHEFNEATARLAPLIGDAPAVAVLERAGVPAKLAAEMADEAGDKGAAWALGQG